MFRRLACYFAVGLLLAALGANSALADYESEVLADSPIAYFRFEETSGTTAADSSTAGANHDATYTAGTTLGQPSAFPALGFAVDFSAPTSVRIPDHADFDFGTGDVTIEFWFQDDTAGRGDLFTYKGGGGDFGIHSASQGADTVSAYLGNFIATTPPVATQGDWHHFVFARDSSLGSNNSSLYLNGVEVATGHDTDSMTIANDLLIGSNHSGDPSNLSLSFDGRIDEVAIYNTPLSASRVAAHFAAAPVPEPSSILLAIVGVGGALGLAIWRRRSSRA